MFHVEVMILRARFTPSYEQLSIMGVKTYLSWRGAELGGNESPLSVAAILRSEQTFVRNSLHDAWTKKWVNILFVL